MDFNLLIIVILIRNLNPKEIMTYMSISTIYRSPTTIEQQWIVKNCRVNPMEPLGPCPDFYEKFTEPVEKLESPPSPAAGIEGVMTTLRSQSIYEDYEIVSTISWLILLY